MSALRQRAGMQVVQGTVSTPAVHAKIFLPSGQVDGATPVHEFVEQIIRPEPKNRAKDRELTAVHHFAKFLKRPITLADLTAEPIVRLLDTLLAAGRAPKTVAAVRCALLQISKAAMEAGAFSALPDVPPVPGKSPPKPWTLLELNRLLASARLMPGTVGSIPAKVWWPALLLTLLDTEAKISVALSTPSKAYDARRGALSLGLLVFELHPLAVESLSHLIPYESERLFPWPFDSGRAPFHMLFREFKTLLYRADLPHVAANHFDRLRITARGNGAILNAVDLKTMIRVRDGKPTYSRARDRRNTESAAKGKPISRRKLAAQKRAAKLNAKQICQIQALFPERTLRHFFETMYLPLRLPDATPDTVESHRRSIQHLCDFAACDVTLNQLSDELVERTAAWMLETRSPATVNKFLRELLAQWRYAYRKRKVLEPPRDIEKFSTAKRVPEAWSQEELGRILDAAATLTGNVCGIPERHFWRALVLTLYDTGLRINALLMLDSSSLDMQSGWLKVPADHQKQFAEQVFHLSAQSLSAIAETLPQERPLLFPWPLKSRSLARHYRGILKKAGLPSGPRDLFHKIRRTSATYVADVAGDEAAQRHLGHSTVNLTRASYIDPRKVRKRIVSADLLERPVTGALQWTNSTEPR